MTRVSATLAGVLALGALGAPPTQADDTVNNPPVAVADVLEMPSRSEVRFDPRTNDSDPDGDTLSIASAVVTSGPGSVGVDLGTQELVIRAAADSVEPLVITYVVQDPGGLQAEATVTVTVTAATPTPQPPAPANHRPVAVKDKLDAGTGNEYRVRVLANDSDPDGDKITLLTVSRAKHGVAKVSGSKIVYQAHWNWTGRTRVTYRIRDAQGATDKGVLVIRVRPSVVKLPKKSARSSRTATRYEVEAALARLGMPTGYVNGTYDSATQRAVCAWRTVSGLRAHRGLPTAKEARRIIATRTKLPRAQAYMVGGVNVSITCQAVFWVSDAGKYRRIMPGTTGMSGYGTRVGTWRIFVTHRTWRYSTIYPEARMYKPMQFSGGQALHGSATDALVTTYPASHGCVRMLHRDIDALQAGGVGNGTLVKVFGAW